MIMYNYTVSSKVKVHVVPYKAPHKHVGNNRIAPGVMPVASESDQKDCEWVVERCKSHLKNNDRDGAKAWIITARSLFPDNFAVQV